jgi:hypothetical protein
LEKADHVKICDQKVSEEEEIGIRYGWAAHNKSWKVETLIQNQSQKSINGSP